jgi:hypothetical protein
MWTPFLASSRRARPHRLGRSRSRTLPASRGRARACRRSPARAAPARSCHGRNDGERVGGVVRSRSSERSRAWGSACWCASLTPARSARRSAASGRTALRRASKRRRRPPPAEQLEAAAKGPARRPTVNEGVFSWWKGTALCSSVRPSSEWCSRHHLDDVDARAYGFLLVAVHPEALVLPLQVLLIFLLPDPVVARLLSYACSVAPV